jgi:hypothetical protein
MVPLSAEKSDTPKTRQRLSHPQFGQNIDDLALHAGSYPELRYLRETLLMQERVPRHKDTRNRENLG